MDFKALLSKDKAPCSKCPYTLGHVKFVVSPCPQCVMNDYQTYHRLIGRKYGVWAYKAGQEPANDMEFQNETQLN